MASSIFMHVCKTGTSRFEFVVVGNACRRSDIAHSGDLHPPTHGSREEAPAFSIEVSQTCAPIHRCAYGARRCCKHETSAR